MQWVGVFEGTVKSAFDGVGAYFKFEDYSLGGPLHPIVADVNTPNQITLRSVGFPSENAPIDFLADITFVGTGLRIAQAQSPGGVLSFPKFTAGTITQIQVRFNDQMGSLIDALALANTQAQQAAIIQQINTIDTRAFFENPANTSLSVISVPNVSAAALGNAVQAGYDARSPEPLIAFLSQFNHIYTALADGASLSGFNNADVLIGGPGNNLMQSNGGNDTLDPGSGGINQMDGGEGSDFYLMSAGTEVISDQGTGANDVDIMSFERSPQGMVIDLELVDGNSGTGFARGDNWVGIEGVIGSNFNDQIIGRSFVQGFPSSDLIFGGAGDDTIIAGEGHDTLSGGPGFDILDGGGNANQVGNPGAPDVAVWAARPDEVHFFNSQQGLLVATPNEGVDLIGNIEVLQFAGQQFGLNQITLSNARLQIGGDQGGTATGSNAVDLMFGRGGNDTLRGLGANDQLDGGDGNDSLSGGTGNDSLTGDNGNDTLDGDEGNDRFNDGFGSDLVRGGAGNDTLTLGDGNDTFDGGAGRDLLIVDLSSDAPTGQTYDANLMRGEVGFRSASTIKDSLSGVEDLLFSGAFDVVATGSGSGNTLTTSSGDDWLLGDGFHAAYAGNTALQVYRLYQATLDRAPDAAGQSDWSGRIAQGVTTLSGAAAGFVGSPEFQNVYGALSNTQFVNLLYQNVLNRTADQGGLQGWLAQLSGGSSRADVVLGFSESREFINATSAAATAFTRTADPAEWSDEVYRIYRATLDRAPDAGGFVNWTDALANGRPIAQVVAGFVGSAEFQNTYGALNNGQFVNLLYQNVLNRAADQGGLNFWLNKLATGSDRSDVVLGFSESQEFINGTAAALSAWMRGQSGSSDRLESGSGNDVMAGGRFADTFVFSTAHPGSDRVVDLEPWDTLAFTGFGYGSEAGVRSHMTQQGADVLFSDQGVTVLIEDTALAHITDAIIEV